ncbi:bis(5'-nucleosyl)-tetraphosphatase [asymmetrical] isoform X2 [Pectinophora gossypiella]|nr:bis(5'-nucleosyl)-tetraphosphatase [asymmetrical] isoform X2 [Pectinophora gossypiella]
MLQTSYGEHHWTPPKGHVDPGESDWVTALRETKEEAGLSESDLNVYKDVTKTLNYEVKGKPKVVVYWLAKLKNPDYAVTLSDEHQDMKWLPLKQAQEIAGYDDMKKLLEEFNEKAEKLLNA